MESTEWQPLFADTKEYETFNSSLRTCTNQGLLTGYPDGSFKPAKGVTKSRSCGNSCPTQGTDCFTRDWC